MRAERVALYQRRLGGAAPALVGLDHQGHEASEVVMANIDDLLLSDDGRDFVGQLRVGGRLRLNDVGVRGVEGR